MVRLSGKLGKIVASKRREVAAQLSGVRLESLRGWADPSQHSLKASLSRAGARFILEVKRTSPSTGALALDADAANLAAAYRGAADAISVLTEGHFFGGSLDDLARVRATYDGPILAKDFIVDPRQVVEARIHGADAILVMISVLSPEEAWPIMREAALMGMEVLVEVHDEAELERALALRSPLIGINNRDLTTFKVDLSVTERLARHVPADRLIVSESGITCRADVKRLAPYADAFLVGTALMRSERPAFTARELAFGRVKICGLTSSEDALAAADCGAAYGGLVFVPNTPRAVSLAEAEPIAASVRERSLPLAGVFRNAKLMEVAQAAELLELDIVQLHGEEDASYIAALRALSRRPIEIWAASNVGRDPARRREAADRTLFDTEVNGCSGGTGRAFDWSRFPRELAQCGILAGGLTPDNVCSAVRTGAWALDVGSGVECKPGRKDPAKLQAFFEALRPPARSELQPCS